MTYHSIKRLVLVISFLAISACDSNHGIAKSKAIVAVIGDSIGNGFSIATPWPTLVSEKLEIPIINTSVNGKPTGWGLEIIDAIIETHTPTHILISLGTNDAAQATAVEVTIANLQEMTYRANNNGIIVLIGNVIPNRQSEEANLRSLKINQGIATIEGAILVDSRSKMADRPGLLADGVHPNQKGQQAIADAFIDALNNTFSNK